MKSQIMFDQNIGKYDAVYDQKLSELTTYYQNLATKYYALNHSYNLLKNKNFTDFEYYDLNKKYDALHSVLQSVEAKHTAVTILYYTNFSNNQEIITLSIPHKKYQYYHTRLHPKWFPILSEGALAEYITSGEPIINEIVTTIKSQTQSPEELANALLDFTQDKLHSLSLRCFPSTATEYKYPIEALVEMGGDCDTHAILYATLMKAAGFDVILLISNEKIEGGFHVAVGVCLENPPTNSLPQIENYYIDFNGKNYYYAETTYLNWRVGDFPQKLKDFTFKILQI